VSSSDSSGASVYVQRSALSLVIVTQAVNLLTSQFPFFSDFEDENVDIWIKTVKRVSHIHAVSDQIIFLAACSKLNKTAIDWLDLNSGDSWLNLKQTISQRFRRGIPFHVTY